MKKCIGCKKIKNTVDFSKDKSREDKRNVYCKKCDNKKSSIWYKNNLEKASKSVNNWRENNRERYVEIQRKWRKNNRERYYHLQRKWQKKNKEKLKAYQIVNYAIRNKELKKLNCKICNSKNTHAHHDNYEEPLNVTWLCPLHHKKLHLEINFK